MGDKTPEGGGTQTAEKPAASFTLTRADVETIFAGMAAGMSTELTESFSKAIADAFSKLPVPAQAQAPRAEVVREAPIYRLNGLGNSFVHDSWNAKHGIGSEVDDAVARLRKYKEQTADWANSAADRLASQFASTADSTTATDAEIIPPGYRPELYVGQLPQGRPLVEACSRGAIANSNPFTIPKFTSATDMVDPSRLEGEAPDAGTIALGTITVTPTSKAGKFRISREMIDASNPAIDMIVMNAMREDYSRKTEQLVATLLETAAGTPSADPTISTAGVYLHTVTGDGADFIDEILDAMSRYWFRRWAMPDRLVLGQDGYRYSATAKDTSGRHLLPRVGASNAIGTGGPIRQGLDFDGLVARPAWALSTTEQDGYLFNSQDIWFWESPLLTFRFDEKSGPENVELAVFGYSGTQILRPSGITAVAFTAGS